MRGLIIVATAAITVTLTGGATTLVSSGLTASEANAQVCFPVGRRVCAFKNGRWRNYRNRCYANRANARPIRNGVCRAASNCATQGRRIVCGTYRGRRVNYRNLCYARRARATNLRYGRCTAGGGNAACNRYAAQALRIVALIRRKGCRVPGSFFYSSNRNTQIRVCRQRTPNQRGGVLASMRGYLQRCQGAGGGNQGARRRACNAYANTTMGLIAQWRAKGCPTGSTRWSPNRTSHYNYCMASGPGNAAQQTRARRAELQRGCFRN